MQSKLLLAALGGAGLASAETVIGLYAFHRHGDRTAKAWQPVNLTSLGADQVFASAGFFRERYLNGSGQRIAGMSADRAVLAQVAVSAPADDVLHSSAGVFAQGLYPPSVAATTEVLANGTAVHSPLGGAQYIPVAPASASAAGSESSSWLQGASGCANAVVSSNNYLASEAYVQTAAASKDFYQGLLPVINGTFDAAAATYKNGYSIFDLVNVADIHNASISSKQLLTKPTLARLYDLASTHEWNLAFNASDPVRAISGAVLAGQILSSLSALAEPPSSPSPATAAPLFTIQFGAYAAFMSFFGLARLPDASADFVGICDYASSMVFELVAPQPTGWAADDLSVRFWFANGTATEESFRNWPLFGRAELALGWGEFRDEMQKIAVADTASWCAACGNKDGACAAKATVASVGEASGSGGVSKPVAGVIGALVTLVVVLVVEAAVLVFAKLRLVKKSAVAGVKSG